MRTTHGRLRASATPPKVVFLFAGEHNHHLDGNATGKPTLLSSALRTWCSGHSNTCTIVIMEQVHRRWWNGKFGMARRVVKIYVDGDAWRVEAIEGFEDRTTERSWQPPSEEDALLLADDLMSDPRPGDDWRDITGDRK